MSFNREHKLETIVYLALWAMLFIAPIVSLSVRTTNTDITFDWAEIFGVWKLYAVYFVVFLIHNHLMAPMLIYQQKVGRYLVLCLAIMAVFQIYQCNHRPNFNEMRHKRGMMVDDKRPPLPPDHRDGDFRRPDGPGFHDDRQGNGRDDHFLEPPHGPLNDSTSIAQYDPEDYRPGPFRERRRDGAHPPLFFGQHDIISLVILILMLGMNLAVKLYFKQRNDQKQMAELEKQNLEQQLEYLKYQINPHFFMNTLNNIHALIDIDPEKAKTTILELSKMMRFVLYEGNKAGVPLDREIAFLQNYITLMKLRYSDKVNIATDIPASLPSREVPPLIFITFVENAFKHGVSYRQESFINIAIDIQGSEEGKNLRFTCANSKIPKEEDKHGGVGLTNIKQRLDLIYDKRYTLDIKDGTDSYIVNLTIPL